MQKTSAERTFEALTWAAVVIWLGFILMIGAVGESWLILMVLGTILLSSAIYQRSRNWETSLSIWIFGIWMAVFSVIEMVNEIVGQVNGTDGLNIDLGVYLGIALVSMGVATILRMIQGPKAGRDVPRNVNVDYTGGYGSGSTGGRESYGPREYDTGRTYNDGQGYSTQQGRTAYDDRSSGQRSQYGRDRASPGRDQDQRSQQYGRNRASQDRDYDQRSQQHGRDRASQGRDYDQPAQYERDARRAGDSYGDGDAYDQTQHAPRDEPGYQDAPPADRGYDPQRQQDYQSQPQGDYAYDDGYQDDSYDEYDYYDEPAWDAPPQVQQHQPQEPRQRRRRQQQSDAPSDLDARVEEIIRRSRDRRSGAAQHSDQPPDDLPY